VGLSLVDSIEELEGSENAIISQTSIRVQVIQVILAKLLAYVMSPRHIKHIQFNTNRSVENLELNARPHPV